MTLGSDLNPLNVHNLRRVDHCPPHFERILFDIRVQEKAISDWIWENLHGRFYIGQMVVGEPGSLRQLQHCAAFEEHYEASYFSLVLDQLNSH